jgi:hypothetical protein
MKSIFGIVFIFLSLCASAQSNGWFKTGFGFFNGDNAYILVGDYALPGYEFAIISNVVLEKDIVRIFCQQYTYNGLNESAILFDYLSYSIEIPRNSLNFRVFLQDAAEKPLTDEKWAVDAYIICRLADDFSQSASLKGYLISKSSIQLPVNNVSLPIYVGKTKGMNRAFIKADIDQVSNSLVNLSVIDYKSPQ